MESTEQSKQCACVYSCFFVPLCYLYLQTLRILTMMKVLNISSNARQNLTFIRPLDRRALKRIKEYRGRVSAVHVHKVCYDGT